MQEAAKSLLGVLSLARHMQFPIEAAKATELQGIFTFLSTDLLPTLTAPVEKKGELAYAREIALAIERVQKVEDLLRDHRPGSGTATSSTGFATPRARQLWTSKVFSHLRGADTETSLEASSDDDDLDSVGRTGSFRWTQPQIWCHRCLRRHPTITCGRVFFNHQQASTLATPSSAVLQRLYLARSLAASIGIPDLMHYSVADRESIPASLRSLRDLPSV